MKIIFMLFLVLIVSGCFQGALESKLYIPMTDSEVLIDYSLPTLENHYYYSGKDKLHALYIPNDKSDKVLFWCHGNAGNIRMRMNHISKFYQAGFSVFIFDYRGYGKSEGIPSEKDLRQDVHVSYRYLQKIIPNKNKIICYGRSLGGALAIDIAADKINNVKALVIDSTFSSLRQLIYDKMSILSVIIAGKSQFDSLSKIKNLPKNLPVLIMHGKEDRLIDYSHSSRLADEMRTKSDRVSLVYFDNLGHNDRATLRYHEKIFEWANGPEIFMKSKMSWYLPLFVPDHWSGTQEYLGIKRNKSKSTSIMTHQR